MHKFFIVLFVVISLISLSNGHGRFIMPPSRSSAWRFGLPTPRNYNDNELFCGGFDVHWQQNNGKCGMCGDAYHLAVPRPNEFGGAPFGLGVIVGTYQAGQIIRLDIELTKSHMGFFEFRVCGQPDASQACLDANVLHILSGQPSDSQSGDLSTRFYPRFGSGIIYEINGVLPAGMTCSHCVIQWRYVAGNNWGNCLNGTSGLGCGPQEEFRACSDITIN